MNTRAQIEATLAALKARQLEADGILAEAREDAANWCQMVSEACQREKSFLDTQGDIADGDLDVTWKLLQESVQRLRSTQGALKRIASEIEDMVADLADDEDSAASGKPVRPRRNGTSLCSRFLWNAFLLPNGFMTSMSSQRCPTCDGIGWLRRQVPHPGTVEHKPVTVTRICPECNGTGKATHPQLFHKERK